MAGFYKRVMSQYACHSIIIDSPISKYEQAPKWNLSKSIHYQPPIKLHMKKV